jgi:hypothetical protein
MPFDKLQGWPIAKCRMGIPIRVMRFAALFAN